MSSNPVNVYYVPCHDPGCWLLSKTKPHVPFALTCSVHGHQLEPAELTQGYVTEFEANQGWTKQRPG